MVDIFDEVRDDLRAERAQQLLRRYGVLLVVLAVLVVAGVAGWQAWRWRQAQQAAGTATTFIDAMNKVSGPLAATPAGAQATPPRTEAAAAFAGLAKTAPEGYRTLAELREAALRAEAGDTQAALDRWDAVAADTKADPLLRDLASLLWAQHQLDTGAPAGIEEHLATLLAPGNPWRPLALETQALLALRTGQDARARDILKQLTTDPMAPDGARARAAGLLTRLGDAPAPDAPAPEALDLNPDAPAPGAPGAKP